MESVLVNFLYASPVGHAIEALHLCSGYHHADADRRIGVVLNSATPVELARLCPFIDEVYPVDIDLFDSEFDAMSALAAIPRDWDRVVNEPRAYQPVQRRYFPGMGRYYDATETYFTGTVGPIGVQPPSYQPGVHFRLPIPPAQRESADRRLGTARPRIAVLPGGSGPRAQYPSTRSWQLILRALTNRFPDATICLTGKLSQDDRTATSFGRAEFETLQAVHPNTVLALDLPIVEQLAVVAECDVLVSPHSGFGMAALTVGTPWLSIAGNKWQEFYFNGTPFYSVLPDRDRFPCYTGFSADPPLVNDDGPRTPSMSRARIRADLAGIVDGAARLIERRWDYQTALTDHVRRLLAFYDGDTNKVWSIDNVLAPYLSAAG
jgi:ADP-heptose:LPS heptosyltransferase